MVMMFARLDKDDQNYPMISVAPEHAKDYNEKGYGVFRTVNEFFSKRRIEELKTIRYWYVEMDGDKGAQLLRIKKSPIYPSRIVESKNGYHIYFSAIEATLDTYREIQEGLIHHFKADPRAKDVTRVLREPGFLHWKDANDPFLVREIFKYDVAYREKDMLYFFPFKKKEPDYIKEFIPGGSEPNTHLPFARTSGANNLTQFLDGLDNEIALLKLSGTAYVNGEYYTFKEVSRRRKNILVNGKPTSCFIDENKRIGATPGGPNVFTWLRYFNHSDKEIIKILKEIYPGVEL